MFIRGIIIGLLFSAVVLGQSIVTPVFVRKDGDASASGYGGSEKDIYVDGGSNPSVGWITFQTAGIDFSKIASAKLVLFVKTVTSPGTLQVQLSTNDITAPENNVPMASIPADTSVAASVALGTADVEKMAQIDLTTAVKSGNFKGVALTSNDGLSATFDSKEGHLAPVILLTYNIDSATVKWLSGASVPLTSQGKDGDFYLNTSTGDVSVMSSGAWTVVINVIGPQGSSGATGAQGQKGDKGDTGPAGATGPQGPQGLTGATGLQGIPGHSPVSSSTTKLKIRVVGPDTVFITVNKYAFAAGQQVRVVRTNLIANYTDGQITAYDTSSGRIILSPTFSAGIDSVDSNWTIFTTGVSGSSSWVDGNGTVSTTKRVGIGASPSASDALTIGGSLTVTGNGSAIKFPDNSIQTTGYVPSQNASASEVSALRDSLNALKAQIAQIKDLLSNFSKVGNEIYITGANLNIRNGANRTDSSNGLGNLVVGYNESSANTRTGSHNIVVGTYHTYSSYGGIVTATHNTISGPYSCVTGGAYNTASGTASSISGGGWDPDGLGMLGNVASGTYSSVSGGGGNVAGGKGASISGGGSNKAIGTLSSVLGGGHIPSSIVSLNDISASNSASGTLATVAGGTNNTASGIYASVTGGSYNTASGKASSITGGGWDPDGLGSFSNVASGAYSCITGGASNTASGNGSIICGGGKNKSTGTLSSILGGGTVPSSIVSLGVDNSNLASGTLATVGGGTNNVAKGTYSSLSGGVGDSAIGFASSVSGGAHNNASGDSSSVSGGTKNVASGNTSSVSGGQSNVANGPYCCVSGGSSNYAGFDGVNGGTVGYWCSVSGGNHNKAYVGSVSGGNNVNLVWQRDAYVWAAGTYSSQ